MGEAAVDKPSQWLENTMAILLVGMVALEFGFLRYAFNTGILMSEELSRFGLVWLVFVGAIVAARDGPHLGTDALVALLSPAPLRGCAIVAIINPDGTVRKFAKTAGTWG